MSLESSGGRPGGVAGPGSGLWGQKTGGHSEARGWKEAPRGALRRRRLPGQAWSAGSMLINSDAWPGLPCCWFLDLLFGAQPSRQKSRLIGKDPDAGKD